MLYKILTVSAIAAMLLSGCKNANGSSSTPTKLPPAITQTYTPSPTATYTPSPTTPAPLEGRLFFDMNGSGLPDEATFNYDPVRLADPRQPLQTDLDKSIDDYVSAHPDIKDGDLITLEEPGLSNYTVCVQSDCVQTDEEGNFSLPNPSGASSVRIVVTDPYADFPAWAMRYINHWNKAIVIAASEMNGVQVPEQHLNDTTVIPLGNGIFITLGVDNKVGLMQGFLTYPFRVNDLPNPVIWNGFDIYWNGIPNNRDGIISNYKGVTTPGNPFTPIWGQMDSHTGLDFVSSVGTYTVASMSGTVDNGERNDHEIMLFLTNDGLKLWSNYGHLEQTFSQLNGANVFKGQIIALTGESGDNNIYFGGPKVPQLHWDIARIPGSALYIDPFATIIPLRENVKFSGSTQSMWTVYNTPVFP